MGNAHKTAITRNKLSAPMAWLEKNRGPLMWSGPVLDYGCGKGGDADRLGLEKYDPHFFPAMPEGKFSLIVCNYVLNVIESEDERAFVLADIREKLSPGGFAFISVRNDRKALNGTTCRGTWQGYIELRLPVVKKTAGFVMYRLDAE